MTAHAESLSTAAPKERESKLGPALTKKMLLWAGGSLLFGLILWGIERAVR